MELVPVTFKNPESEEVPVVCPWMKEYVEVPTYSSFVVKIPAAVDEPEPKNPPANRPVPDAETEKIKSPAEFVKRRKSPVAFLVDEAWIKIDSVEVPAIARRALGASK